MLGLGLKLGLGGVGFSPSSIPDLALWLDAADTSSATESSNLVSQINDKSGNGDNVTQSTEANRPSYGVYKSNPAPNLSSQLLPDATQGSDTGKGFTITGLSYDSGTDTFYAGNIGKATPISSQETPQIVNLSKDGSTIIGQIAVGATHDLQGLSYDTFNDNHVYAVPSNNQIYKINKDGTNNAAILTDAQLTAIGITAVQALAFDTVRGQYWIGQGNEVKRVTAGGTEARTYTLDAHADIDHFYHDPVNDHLWITYGISGGWGFVVVIDCDTSIPTGDAVFVKNFQLPNSYAVEGISVVDDVMYVGNDGYYHNADIIDSENQINALQSYSTNTTGKDALLFDGSTSYMNMENLDYGETTIIVAHIPYSDARMIIGNQGTSGQRFYLNVDELEVGSEKNTLSVSPIAQGLITVAKVDGTGSATSSLNVGGGSYQTAAVTRTGISSNFDLGRSPYDGDYYRGLIEEVLVFNRNLSDIEVNKIANYLKSKWGASWVNI